MIMYEPKPAETPIQIKAINKQIQRNKWNDCER